MMFALLLSLYLPAAHAHLPIPPGTMVPMSQDAEVNVISKRTFDRALNRVEKVFTPIMKKQLGCTLKFNRLWTDSTVNSDTTREGNDCIVNSYGGLARAVGIRNEAAYAAVACHEVGHHMGGAPLYTGEDWASCEGEADYWAAKECMIQIGYTHAQAVNALNQLADTLADLNGDPVPRVDRIDQTVVKKTFEEHPNAQCRLDTYLNGLECAKHGPADKKDPKVNACHDYPTAKTYALGSRPRCWFAPAK